MRTKKDIQMLLESGLSSAFVANLSESQMKSLIERFGRDKKNISIKNSELKNKVKNFIKTYSKIKDIEKNIDDWSDEKLVDQMKGYANRSKHSELNKKAEDIYKEIVNDMKGNKKEETKEQSTVPQNTTVVPKPQTPSYQLKPNSKTMVNGVEVDTTGGKTIITPLKELEEDETINVVDDPDATADGMPTTEGVIKEKFQSKAQQGFFWAKCNTSKGVKKKKWCELAREFSDSTPKKDYEKMPYKKKSEETDEVYDKFLEDRIVEMIERHIQPKMTKSDLLKTISEKKQKSDSMILKNPKKMSMFSHESGIESKKMKRPTQMMPIMGTMEENETKEKERTKEKDKTKERDRRKGNPFRDPNPGVKEDPRGSKKTKEQMKQDFIGLINKAL